MKFQLETTVKEKFSLQKQLSDAVNLQFEDAKKKNEMISDLRKEKLLLQQELSPLKRKLFVMETEIEIKTTVLTDSNSKLAILQKEKEEQERVQKEEAQRQELHQQIRDGISDTIPTIRNEVILQQAALFARELE